MRTKSPPVIRLIPVLVFFIIAFLAVSCGSQSPGKPHFAIPLPTETVSPSGSGSLFSQDPYTLRFYLEEDDFSVSEGKPLEFYDRFTERIIRYHSRPVLTEKDVEYVKLITLPAGDPSPSPYAVCIIFNTTGRIKLNEITSNNIGSRLAVVVNDQLLFAPVIKTVVRDGKTRVTFSWSKAEAEAVASLMAQAVENSK